MRIFILFIAIISLVFSQEENIKIGIDPPDTIGKNYYKIDESTKQSLDQAFSASLFKLTYRKGRNQKRVFTTILAGKDLEKVVEEQNYHIEEGCDNDECPFDLGQVLGVEYLLIPTVIYHKPGVVRISLKLADIVERTMSSLTDEIEVPLCDLKYRNDLIDRMITRLYNNSNQPGSIETITINIDGKKIRKQEYHRGGIREIIKRDKNGQIPKKIDKAGNEELQIKRSKKPEIKPKKLKTPECAKEEESKSSSSNNKLLLIGGLLLILIAAAAGGGGGGGAPIGGVDIGITVP